MTHWELVLRRQREEILPLYIVRLCEGEKGEVKSYTDKKYLVGLKCIKQHKYKRKWRNILSTEAQSVVHLGSII